MRQQPPNGEICGPTADRDKRSADQRERRRHGQRQHHRATGLAGRGQAIEPVGQLFGGARNESLAESSRAVFYRLLIATALDSAEMRYQDVKQDYVGVRGELSDLRSGTANLILVVDTLLSRMQTHRYRGCRLIAIKRDTVTIHVTAQEYLEARAAIAEARRRLQERVVEQGN